jgi:hypothetical protein
MGDIIKHEKKELSTTVDQQVANSEYKGLKIGSILINRDGDRLYKVTKLEVEGRRNWDKTRDAAKEADDENNFRDDKYERFDEVLKVYYIDASDWEGTNFKDGRESSEFIDEFDKYSKGYAILEDGKSVEQYFAEAKSVISGEKSLSEYADTSMNSSGTDLVSLGSKEHLEVMSQALSQQQNKAQLIKNFVSRELEKQKQELDGIRRELGLIVEDFKNKVEKINKVIHTIELYLGIKEDIVQIQEGANAPTESPICFRQEVMFMDEEVGDPRSDGQGLDFRVIEDFDEWLCSNENYKHVIPEEKGVVVLRVRRNDKKYSDNPFINSMMNEENMKTYILIRNGDNLYRIWADINIQRLFPRKTELIDMQEKAMSESDKYSNDDFWKKERTQKNIKEVEDIYLRYQKQIIMLQGLIDRTQIFMPLAAPIKLTDPEIHGTDLVKFIYDDEVKLGDGHVSWWDFLKKANENIGIGSRIMLVHVPRKDADDRTYRLDARYNKGWNNSESSYGLPSSPKSGLYQVEYTQHTWSVRVDTDEDNHQKWGEKTGKVPCIKYNPNDEIYNSWNWRDSGHTRKNRISWRIHPKDDWNWIIDVDNISIEDIDFYLDSRTERKNYLKMMPILWEIRKFLLKEVEEEKDFIKMMAGILIADYGSKKSLEEVIEMVKEASVWWKTKNKWKRALGKDDEKALRMIVNRLKKKV